ncbi:MAG: protoheme IX farnesyltransferase, partial [Rhodospirillaceae bacterium]|nr:protoheme IX farnesyltransferase [Rhodospirillaceae bacterium]
GIPMLPVVAGARATKRQMLAYTVVLAPVAVAPWPLGVAGALYGVGAAVLGALFIVCAVRVLREDGEATGHRGAKLMFGFSIFYLFAVFALLIADRLSVDLLSAGSLWP